MQSGAERDAGSRSGGGRYLIAVCLPALALLVRLTLAPWLFERATYLPFFFAVAATAVRGGMRAGLTATALSAALSAYFLLSPLGSFAIASSSDRLHLLLFASVSACICWLSGSLHDALRRAEREQGLRRSEQERFRLAAEAINGIVYEFDFLTGHVERQRGLYEVLGFHPGEVPPTAAWWWEQIHPDDRQVVEQRFTEAADDVIVRAYRVRHRDGRWLHVEDRAVLLRGDDGRPRRMVGCTVDVTEKTQAERGVRENDNRFHSLVTAISQVVWTTAPDGRVVDDSPTWRAFTGQSLDEWTGWGWLDAVHPDDRARAEAAWRQAIERRATYALEYRLRRHDGQYRWTLVRGVPVVDADGGIREWVGTNIDIDERRAREVFIDGILGSITDAFFVLDADWRFTFANDEIVSRFGRRRDHVIGARVWELFPDAVGNQAHVHMHRAMADRIAVEYEVFHPPWQRWFLDRVFPTADGGLAVYSRDVTDRKQAEERIRDSERRLAAILDQLPVGVGVIGLDGRMTLTNRIMSRFVPATIPSLDPARRSRWRAWGPDGSPLLPEDWPGQQAMRGVAVVPGVEFLFTDDDGRDLWTSVTTTPLRDGEGLVAGAIVVIQDIDARKRAEEAVRLSEARLRLALRDTGILVYSTDAELRYTWLHNPHPTFLPDDVLGQRDDDLLPPGHAAPLTAIKQRVLDSGVGEKGEVALDVGGTRHVYHLAVEPLHDANGTVVGVTAAAMDITAVRQAEETLRFQRDLTKSITDTATTAIFMMDITSRCTFMNPAAERMTGFAFKEVEGRILHDLIHHHRPDGRPYPMTECPIDRALPERGEVRDHEDLFFRKRGDPFPVMCNARVVYEGGVAVGTVIEVRDITTEKAAADELRRLMDDLSQADKLKDEFLATLAHELRNPLAPLRNGLQIIKLAGSTPDVIEKSRAMMERQIGQMAHLIDDLMDVSRISQGKIVLQRTRLRLADVVCDAVDAARPLIKEHGHEFTLEVPSEPLLVDGDRTRLAQVFGNLLNDAAKYTQAGGRIRLTVERQGDDAVVCVQDNGIGIPAHMLTRVFEMFAQVDRSLEKSQGGLGIGLNIAKRLVEMHGGDIVADSDGHGAGSRFVVRLPVVPTVIVGSSGGHAAVSEATPARRRILVVDDNRDGATSLAEMLAMMGNQTQTAHDGVEAVQAAQAFEPDVILMDLGMPRLNGYEACRRIRAQPWGRGIVIVAQTGWGQEDDRRKSQDAGFDLHVIKPIDPVALEKLLADLDTKSG